jgi:hypothetical protein
VAFDKARKCIIDPRTRCLTPDDPAVQTAQRHFQGMFQGTREELYGKETGTVVMPHTRLEKGTRVITIADYTATAGAGGMIDVVEVRARAFSNVMDAYLVYLTALVKTVVPLTLPHVDPSAVPEAPKLPKGYGWAEVAGAVEKAKQLMATAGRSIFGINSTYHPERYADYIETIGAWADVSLELRGAWDYFAGLNMLATWTEGTGKAAQKFVENAFTSPAEFMDDFVRAEAKIQEANVVERKALKDAEQKQRKARIDRMKAEPRLGGRGQSAKPLTAAQSQMLAGARSLFRSAPRETSAASTETAAPALQTDELADLFGLTAERQTAAAVASRVIEPVGVPAPASESGSDVDLIDSLFMGLNNPRGALRRGTSSKMRYPRGR